MCIKLHLDVNGPFPDINVKHWASTTERPADHLYEIVHDWRRQASASSSDFILVMSRFLCSCCFTSSHLHVINKVYAYLACCLRGGLRARNFGPNPEYPPPLQVRTGIVVSVEKGWWRDAGKLSRNRGKSAVYIYTPLILLTGLITDCAPLVLIKLIIWTCSSRTLLIKHHML